MAKKIRVLHLIHWFVRGGIESYLLNVLKHYDRSRMQFDVCCKGVDTGPLAYKADELKVPVFRIPMKATQITFINKLSDLLKDGQYDVLHSHVGELSGPAVYAAKKAGLKVRISAYHNTFPNTAIALQNVAVLKQIRKFYLYACHKTVLKYSTHISGCSWAALKSYFGQLTETDGRFYVNYYGVDTNRFETPYDRQKFRAENNLAVNKKIVGHVGSFRWEKNHKGFLEISERLAKKNPEVQFVFVGDGALRPEIEELAKNKFTHLDVVFLGNRGDIPDVIRVMDAMLFPSLREGFGMAVIEAAAAGVPVVASSESGLVEAMAPENMDFTFKIGDYDSAAEKICELLTNEQTRQSYMQNAKHDLNHRFSMDAACNSLYKMYVEGLKKG